VRIDLDPIFLFLDGHELILGISRAALWRELKQFKSEQPDQ
jgi:hypothetical protein